MFKSARTCQTRSPKKTVTRCNERLLTCIDLTPDAMVADSFEVLAENLPFNEAGSLVGKTAELHVTHMMPRNVGVRLQGKVFATAPAKVVRSFQSQMKHPGVMGGGPDSLAVLLHAHLGK